MNLLSQFSSVQKFGGTARTGRGRSSVIGAISLIVMCATLASPSANASEPYADQIIDAVRTSTPSDAPAATESPISIASDDEGQFVGASEEMTFALPDAGTGSVVLDSTGDVPLSVALPRVDTAEPVLTSDSDALVYPDGRDHTAVAVQAFDAGAQLSTVLNATGSPETFAYEVAVPDGGSLRLLEEGGVAVLDANGDAVGFMSTPWARDGSGVAVPTTYSVSGNVVTQIVEHVGDDFQYPIVADPYLFKDLVASASWDWIPRSPGGAIGAGWTLRVKPTTWARFNGGSYFVGWLGWRELYRKYKKRGLNKNLDTMKDQWICHHQFVTVRKPFAKTWNLDEWRKDVSYAKTVRALCNPPRGGKYVWD